MRNLAKLGKRLRLPMPLCDNFGDLTPTKTRAALVCACCARISAGRPFPNTKNSIKTARGDRWRHAADTDLVECGVVPVRDYIRVGLDAHEKRR
jgi:hypothetical protein